jgi:curved DNA-binding protein CbpA
LRLAKIYKIGLSWGFKSKEANFASKNGNEAFVWETLMAIPNYYEFLQISSNAETETIHRVFRYLAARLHPDNAESGDAEKFMLLNQAYDVLSDSARRAEYDAACAREVAPQPPLSTSVDFMDNIDGELNRRLAVLSVLYYRRRTSPSTPEVSLMELEERMGFPRDYLEFTTWYLLKKDYITRADNSAFTLTATGVDFVEEQRAHLPVLNKLLTNGESSFSADSIVRGNAHKDSPVAPDHVIVLPERTYITDRRVNKADRRTSKMERQTERRAGRADRHTKS